MEEQGRNRFWKNLFQLENRQNVFVEEKEELFSSGNVDCPASRGHKEEQPGRQQDWDPETRRGSGAEDRDVEVICVKSRVEGGFPSKTCQV